MELRFCVAHVSLYALRTSFSQQLVPRCAIRTSGEPVEARENGWGAGTAQRMRSIRANVARGHSAEQETRDTGGSSANQFSVK